MKILHTSDLHFGIELYGMSMLNEQRHFVSCFADIIKQSNADAVVISGDVYDNTVSSSAAISLYNSLAEEICINMNKPMLVIAGNHDGAARLSSLKSLLEKSGLYVTGKLTRDIQPVIIDGCAFYGIPHFNADEVKALYPAESIKTYQDAYLTVMNNIRKCMDKSLTNIAIAHAYVSGASLCESDTAAVIGTASMISADVFEDFDYVALGHLHKAQNVGKNCRYSGSPVKYSFSEASCKKSVTLFDTDTKTIEEIPLTPLNDMSILKGNFAEIIKQSSNDYLKIEVADKFIGQEMLETLKSVFPNLMSVVGKSADSSDEITITVQEIKSMTPKEALESFFKEIYGENVTDFQAEMFCNALAEAQKGDDRE